LRCPHLHLVSGMKMHGAFLSRLLSLFLACLTSKKDLHFIYLEPGIFIVFHFSTRDLESRSRYSDWLRADDRGVGVFDSR
jgi:hypothetical protein